MATLMSTTTSKMDDQQKGKQLKSATTSFAHRQNNVTEEAVTQEHNPAKTLESFNTKFYNHTQSTRITIDERSDEIDLVKENDQKSTTPVENLIMFHSTLGNRENITMPQITRRSYPPTIQSFTKKLSETDLTTITQKTSQMINTERKTQLIQATQPMNFAEALYWCTSLGFRFLEEEELEFREINGTSRRKSDWFFVNAKEINATWFWRNSLTRVNLPKRKNNNLPNYNSEEAQECLVSNTRRVTEIPCLMKIKPLCIKDDRRKNDDKFVVDTYFNARSETKEKNCQFNYVKREFKCHN